MQVLGEARQALKGKPFVVFNSDLRIKVQATGLYTYPDASIICGDLELDDEVRNTALNPTLIVEVLPDSTEKYGRGEKAIHYRQIESLRALLLISQKHARVERFVRQDSGGWLLNEQTDLGDFVELQSIGLSIAMNEIYRNVNFQLHGSLD